MMNGQPARNNAVERQHKRPSDNTNPIHLALYCIGPSKNEFGGSIFEKMLDQNIIGPAQTKRAAPTVSVPKLNITPRFCVNQSKLNAVIRRKSYPMPNRDKSIDFLGEGTVLSTHEAKCDYLKVEIIEKGCDKNAFISHHELYGFERMSF